MAPRSSIVKLLLLLALCTIVCAQFDDKACAAKYQKYGSQLQYEDLWHGQIRGIYPYIRGNISEPVTLTTQGCRKICGTKPRYHDILTAFGILTTWVLPIIALVANLPFESEEHRQHQYSAPNKNDRDGPPVILKRTNIFEPLVNWLGSPQSAFTNILNNLQIQVACTRILRRERESRKGPRNEEVNAILRDSLYVLCCVNQYSCLDYTRLRTWRHNDGEGGQSTATSRFRRDRALIAGLLFPLYRGGSSPQVRTNLSRLALSRAITHSTGDAPAQDVDVDAITRQARVHLEILAHQLRLLRRRGMYPMILSVLWFLVAFVVGLYQCFRALGEYTVAHSLGLGLLVTWLPVLVLMAIADRNPNGTERCKILMERWLHNIDAILESHQTDDKEIQWWRHGDKHNGPNEMSRYPFGEFVGQGRRVHFCGVAHFLVEHLDEMQSRLVDQVVPNIHARAQIRPQMWWLNWAGAQLIVAVAVITAFIVAWNTPTVGFGCRSFFYLIQLLLGSTTWLLHGVFNEFRGIVRFVSLLINTMSTCLFFLLMIIHTGGIFNTCFCQSSLFGSRHWGSIGNWGGYVQFGTQRFYDAAYHPDYYWYPAACIGLLSCLCCMAWTLWSWRRVRMISDDTKATVRVVENVGIPLDWLL